MRGDSGLCRLWVGAVVSVRLREFRPGEGCCVRRPAMSDSQDHRVLELSRDIALKHGELRIENYGADLVAKLFELLQPMANDWQAIARAVETGSLRPKRRVACPSRGNPFHRGVVSEGSRRARREIGLRPRSDVSRGAAQTRTPAVPEGWHRRHDSSDYRRLRIAILSFLMARASILRTQCREIPIQRPISRKVSTSPTKP